MTNTLAKITTLAAISLAATFSTANAQDPHPGETIYKTTCFACHGATGEGIPNVFPPVAGSEWVNGPAENLVKIQLRGLMGPITVKGKEFNGVMPPNAAMTDQQLADVLTYVRSNMGNNAPAVTAETVKAIRAQEAGNASMLTVKDLIDPAAPAAEEAPKPEPATEEAALDTAEATEATETTPTPAPEPTPAVEPTPEAEPTPEPAVEPTPEVEPTPTPAAEPTPEAEPAPAPEAAPATTAPEAPATTSTDEPHPGEALYKAKCVACHGPTGDGMANMFPPLTASEWVNGPAENLIRIQLHGLTGPIVVKGQQFNGMMPSNATMSDEEIAHVLTYVRSNMGNTASAVTPDMVKTLREAAGPTPAPLTAADLIDPTVKEDVLTEATELEGFKPAQHNSSGNTIFWAIGIIGLCTVPAVAGLARN